MIPTLFQRCGKHMLYSLFPYDVENRFWVVLINIVHILGVLAIQFGIILPHKLLRIYILYLLLLLVTYILLNNRCFMTVISNYFGKVNYNSLCIKMNEARSILLIYLLIAIFFYYRPEYSIYNLFVKKIIN